MIVCVCNNVSDRHIRSAVEDGVSTMRELRVELEVGTCCGKCHSCAKDVLRQCLADKKPQAVSLFPAGALAA